MLKNKNNSRKNSSVLTYKRQHAHIDQICKMHLINRTLKGSSTQTSMELAIKLLKKTQKDFFKEHFLHHTPPSDMHLSHSKFYYQSNKTMQEFLKNMSMIDKSLWTKTQPKNDLDCKLKH